MIWQESTHKAAEKIQKVWKGHLAREKFGLVKRKQGKLRVKELKRIQGKTCHVSISEEEDNFSIRVYEVLHYFEFLLVVPKYARFSSEFLFKHLDFHPLRLYYIYEEPKKSLDWEIVLRALKRIDGVIYVFQFYRKIDTNKIKIVFYEIGEKHEHSTILYSDFELKGKSVRYIKKVIERKILKKLFVYGNCLELRNYGDKQSFDVEFENSIVKIKKFV